MLQGWRASGPNDKINNFHLKLEENGIEFFFLHISISPPFGLKFDNCLGCSMNADLDPWYLQLQNVPREQSG